MLTVVIPSRNRHAVLIHAARSASELSRVSDVIIVDDGSVPELSPSLFSGLVGSSKIRILKNDVWPGGQGARCCGVRNAATEIVVFLDSDDVLLGQGVDALYDALISSPDVALAYANVLSGDNPSDFLRCSGHCFRQVLRNMSLCSFSGLMIRKSLIPVDRLLLGLPSWQDDDFCLVASEANEIRFVDALSARMTSSPDSTGRSTHLQLVGLTCLLDKWKGHLRREFGVSRLMLWRMRQLNLLVFVVADDLRSCKSPVPRVWICRILSILLQTIGRGIRLLLYPFFDRLYS